MSTYFSGKPCKRGHRAERYTGNRTCVTCAKEQSSARFAANKEKCSEQMRAWRVANQESHSIKKRAYYEANKERENARTRARYTSNRDELIAYARLYYDINQEKCREYARAYQKAHPVECLALINKRRARKAHALPPWLTAGDHREITKRYEQAAWLTMLTGVEHHVDHIVPLQGRDVCGLHVPGNLQVLTAHQNLSKSNKQLEQV